MEKEIKKYNTVLVFGVFDRLHDGHRFFIDRASALGEHIIIAVARDTSVLRLKDRMPMQNETVRTESLAHAFPSATIILGDEDDHAWNVILKYEPDCIALGYDQNALQIALEKERPHWPFLRDIVTLPDHDGQRLHSSLL